MAGNLESLGRKSPGLESLARESRGIGVAKPRSRIDCRPGCR
jgi:hypothetical protein